MVTPEPLFNPALLTNAALLYYTSPAGTRTLLKKITATSNDTAAAHPFTLWLVPLGGAPTNANVLINQRQVGPLETFDVTGAQNHTLGPGWMLYAESDDNTHLNIQATGIAIV